MTEQIQERRDYGFAIGLMTGTFVGAGLAIWLAPKAAAELRDRVTDSAKDFRKRTPNNTSRPAAASARRSTEQTEGQDVRDDVADVVARGARTVERFAVAAKAAERSGVAVVGLRPSFTASDSRVPAILSAPQEPRIHEGIKQRFTNQRVEAPEPLGLLPGQVQTGNPEVLGLYEAEPVMDRRLSRVCFRHMCAKRTAVELVDAVAFCTLCQASAPADVMRREMIAFLIVLAVLVLLESFRRGRTVAMGIRSQWRAGLVIMVVVILLLTGRL
jgi:gas vesicle protein